MPIRGAGFACVMKPFQSEQDHVVREQTEKLL